MLNLIHSQDTKLLERPSAQLLHELAVAGLDLLAAELGNLGVEPLILQHLGGTNNGQASRVTSLEGRNEGELLASGKEVLWVDGIGMLLGVIAVSRLGSTQDRHEERSGTENLADAVGEGHDGVVELKVVLQSGSDVLGGIQDENVVLLGSGDCVVVEMVYHGAGSFGRESNIDLRQQSSDRGGGRCGRG